MNKKRIAWNKGLRGVQKSHRKGITMEEEYGVERTAKIKKKRKIAISGEKHFFFGKHFTQSHRDNIGKANKGNLSWITGKHHSEETKKKISDRLRENGNLKKPRPYRRGIKPTKETIKKCLTRHIPSSLEEKFLDIAKRHNLPYKYVGNGKFFIDRFNPDFINTNSEKIAVEVYARYYKKRNHISIENWKNKRAKVFEEYGWKLLFFNEVELNDDNVLVALSANSREIGDEEVT